MKSGKLLFVIVIYTYYFIRSNAFANRDCLLSLENREKAPICSETTTAAAATPAIGATAAIGYSVPSTMIEFYKNYNPQDVEISYPGLEGAVRFYSVDALKELNSEYDLGNNSFVFASCNGDPLFIMHGGVYTTLHGTFKPEKVASSFDEFLVNYIASRQ